MAVYMESYVGFSISLEVTSDSHRIGGFACKASIDTADGKKVMSMVSSERFQSETEAKAFGLNWGSKWIDNNTVGGER